MLSNTALGTAPRSSTMMTLFWPDGLACTTSELSGQSVRNPGGSRAPPRTERHWVVGWNPRGLVVVVAALIRASTLREGLEKLQQLRDAAAESDVNGRILRYLRVLGSIDPVSSNWTHADDPDLLRQREGDAWLELIDGPQVRQLYVCGYRHASELHIVQYACGQRYTTQQLTLTPLARLRAVLNSITVFGPEATSTRLRPVPGAQSILEGRLLDLWVAQLLRRSNRTPIPASGSCRSDENDDDLSLTTSAKSATSHCDDDYTTTDSSGSEDDVSSLSSEPSFFMGPGGSGPAQPSGSGNNSASPRSDVPPRLNYPTEEAMTELSALLGCCTASSLIRGSVRSSALEDDDSTTTDRDDLHHSSISAALCRTLPILSYLLTLVQRVPQSSYTARLVELRLREAINACCILDGTAVNCGLHPAVSHALSGGVRSRQRRMCVEAFFCRQALDVALGFLVCVLVYKYRSHGVEPLRAFAWHMLNKMHLNYIGWFEGWPAGFKMNDDLNRLFTLFDRSVLELWTTTLDVFNVDWVNLSLSIFCCLCWSGLSVALAFVSDCCNLATQHLRGAFHVLKTIYVGVRRLITSLLHVFRGKKYNPLRQRMDLAAYSQDQVLIGTLFLTVAAFLFPTLALHYYYFALVRTSVWVVQESISGLSYLVAYNPIGALLNAYRWRNEYPSGVEIGGVSRTAAGSVLVRLQVKPMRLADAFIDCVVVLRLVTEPLMPSKLLRFIVSATSKPALNSRWTLFPHLIADCHSPPLAGALALQKKPSTK